METDERKPGWYDDPREPGARRYWTGDEWTTAYQSSEADEPERDSVLLPSFWILAGAVGLWFAETYKWSVSDALSENSDSLYLRPGVDHAVLLASILVILLGAIRLLVVLTRR